MAQHPRDRSEFDTYHIFSRGVGGHILFEDDSDRMRFLQLLSEEMDDYKCEVFAYCLMSNHYHLAVRQRLELLNVAVGTLQSRYARYFNKRHVRYGHLFQGRFGSRPIHSDEHLLTVVRYIHLNPVEEGLSDTCDYQWSSYHEYLETPSIVKRELVLGILGGRAQFSVFHNHGINELKHSREGGHGTCYAGSNVALEDAEAIARIKRSLGNDVLTQISTSEKETRDVLLKRIKQLGFTSTRIARITGLGYSIVKRA